MNILLLTLDTFSRTGGIQLFNRCLQLGLCKFIENNGGSLTHKCLVDKLEDADDKYGTSECFSFAGFRNSKGRFIADVLIHAHRFDLILFGHVNLVPLALLPAFRNKDCRLVAHGVEVWEKLPFLKWRGLRRMNRILAVSRYTAERLHSQHQYPERKTDYFPNCLDPWFAASPVVPVADWNRHWRLDTQRTYLLTLARLSATEQAKGYDEIIKLLPALITRHPNLYYLLAGKWDDAEYTRIRQLAESHGVTDRVLMPGFVAASSLPALYNLASVFVLPSLKEGFGIVYLEAAWWGCPVVAYRAGGVPEALLEGKLGSLIEPGNAANLSEALHKQISQPSDKVERLTRNRTLIEDHFGFANFCSRLQSLLK